MTLADLAHARWHAGYTALRVLACEARRMAQAAAAPGAGKRSAA